MKTMKTALVPALIGLISFSVLAGETPTAQKKQGHALSPTNKVIRIAVVEDGPCAYFDELTKQIKTELDTILAHNGAAQFVRKPEFSAHWQYDQVQPALEKALNDPAIDLVLLAGMVAANSAGEKDFTLSKPVISGFVQDPDTLGLPYNQQGKSTKPNFNFVVIPLRASRDIEVFKEMIPFNHLMVVVDDFLLEGAGDDIDKEVAQAENNLGTTISIARANKKAEDVLKQIAKDVDAVYLTPALRMKQMEWQKVIDGLNERKLPTFSMMGHRDVEAGVLAGLQPECNERLARRMALNIQQVMMGIPPEDLQVPMAIDEQLVINAKTAAQIGYSPSFDIMVQAIILHGEALESGDPLTLREAIHIALENNADLAIKQATVRGAQAGRKQAMSTLLPQLDGDVTYSQQDSATAEAAQGSIPEKQTKGTLSASQVIFNDPAMTQYRTATRNYKGELADQEATRLDVIENASTRYLQLLQAHALYRIEMDNLSLTRSNLELARVRYEVGTAGPEEVYRWESEAAAQKGHVLEAESKVETAQVALNQVMGVALDRQWLPEDISLDTNRYFFLDEKFSGRISTDEEYQHFQNFAVGYSLQNAYELKALDERVEAAQLSLHQLKRRFFTPELGVRFSYGYTFDNEYNVTPAPDRPDDEWLLGVQASLPLFQGGGKIFDVAAARAQLDKFIETRTRTEQQVEQRTKNVLYQIGSSFPNIQLQRSAAIFSAKNLDVIKDKYARGIVSILDLLDAQNQAFVASQNAEIAKYSYLSDIMQLQRTLGWFEADKTDDQKKAFVDELENYMSKFPSKDAGQE